MQEHESQQIKLSPIGTIHSPFQELDQMPIQPTSRLSAEGYARIYPQYVAGLKDLEGFSHVILIYYFHRTERADLTVTPFLDDQPRGVFATRAPTRPNPIGISIVSLKGIEGDIVKLGRIDILDGTPLLDIKPYVPEFDQHDDVRTGWLQSARGKIEGKASDDRFK